MDRNGRAAPPPRPRRRPAAGSRPCLVAQRRAGTRPPADHSRSGRGAADRRRSLRRARWRRRSRGALSSRAREGTMEASMRRSERGAALCNALGNGVHSARPLIRCVVRGWWGEGRISGRGETGCRDRRRQGQTGQGQGQRQRRDERGKGKEGAADRAGAAAERGEGRGRAMKSARCRGERSRRKGTRARAAEL